MPWLLYCKGNGRVRLSTLFKTNITLNKCEREHGMLSEDNDNTYSSGSDDYSDELEKILSSEKWVEYFNELSKTVHVELSAYGAGGAQLFTVNEQPLCTYIRSLQGEGPDCPHSCLTLAASDEPAIFKCQSGMICFSFPVERFGDRVFIVGRGGFASYEDLLDFLKIVRVNNYPQLPVSEPLSFPEKENMNAISQYIHLSINRQMNSVEAKYKLEEKLLRVTSLFDSQAFGTLSRNPQLMYRYIVDTIEFVFGKTSAALMVLGEDESLYRTTYSIGKVKETIADMTMNRENPVIKKIQDTKAAIFFEDIHEAFADGQFGETGPSYFLPIFVGDVIAAVVGIFNREFAREDMKILNAFREYVQLNLENQNLRVTAGKNKKANEKLSHLADVTSSILSILDKDRLLNTLLDKSLQLTNAEQGSLMLMDQDTAELVVEARRSVDDMVMENMRFKKDEGISGMVLEHGGSLLVEDIEKDPRIRKVNRPRYRTKSFVSVPIKIEDRLAGVLNLSDKIKGDVFNEQDLHLIESFISNVAIAIERSILYKETEKLQKLSITDHLTGIYNRRYLNRRLSEEITRYNRYKHPFSFMMLDLDKFKEYNDTFGHIAGDNLLKNLAAIMEQSLRTIDIAARFGGDEFVSIFPQTPKVDAIQISNRLKEKVDKALSAHNEMPLTISMGLATFPDDASSIMELIEKTDQALYLAKKGGGNRVVYL